MGDESVPPTGEIRSYILRLWAEGEPPARIWRASLTLIPDGERVGFADLEAAFEHLREQVCKSASEQGGVVREA